MKNILIIILIAILALVSFLLFIKVNLDYQEINQLKKGQLENDKKYLENLSRVTEMINTLQDENDKLRDGLKEVVYEIKDENFQMFEVTAYTSNECGTVAKLGIDLKANYSKFLNICAVDPNVIPLGSTVLIRFADGIEKAYFACDTGGLIKGRRIDIYMTDVNKALEFGKQKLMVKVIK